jgi:hypothetical protein
MHPSAVAAAMAACATMLPWLLARVSLSDVDPQTKLDWPDFDPYSASGRLIMARIDKLIARSNIVDAPLS